MQENFQKIDTEACLQAISHNPRVNEGLVKLTAYLAGQFGHLCDVGGNNVIEALVENFDWYSGSTQASILSAMIKISTRLPELKNAAIQYMYDHLSSQNLEVVQRSREGGALLSSQEIILKKTLQTPRFTGITYYSGPAIEGGDATPQEDNNTQKETVGQSPRAKPPPIPTGSGMFPPRNRRPSDSQWQSQLVSPIHRQGSLHAFEVPGLNDSAALIAENDAKPLIHVIDMPEEDNSDEHGTLLTDMSMPIFSTSVIDLNVITEKQLKILDHFRENPRGVIYEGDDYTILGMVEMNPPVATLTYKIQSFSPIPMSIDKFNIKDTDGLQFALSDRPYVIPPNGYVIIKDHVRTTNVFSTHPLISIFIGGWMASAPVPILQSMWANSIDVDQQNFVARWKALGDSDHSLKTQIDYVKDSTEAGICAGVKSALGIDKLQWSPPGRPAFSGSFKIASGNTGFLIVFSFDGPKVFIEVRSTNGITTKPLVQLI